MKANFHPGKFVAENFLPCRTYNRSCLRALHQWLRRDARRREGNSDWDAAEAVGAVAGSGAATAQAERCLWSNMNHASKQLLPILLDTAPLPHFTHQARPQEQ